MFDLLLPVFLAQSPQQAPQVEASPAAPTAIAQLLPHQTEPLPDVFTPPPILVEYQSVRPLPGGLNQVPVFNSNSPEVIRQEGILLSTFPKSGKTTPSAHLDQALEGRFDIFTHHISRPDGEPRTLYQGLLVSNPTGQTRTIRVLQGLSYLNSEDAPFRELLPFVEDPGGFVYSGPGSRLAGDLLRGKNQTDIFPEWRQIPPYSTEILFNLPIPPSSARSTYLRLESDGGVYLANLAKYEVEQFVERVVPDDRPVRPPSNGGNINISPSARPTKVVTTSFRRPPTPDEWRALLTRGKLVTPRDLAPVPTRDGSRIIYGRVAGVSMGSEWRATIGDRPNSRHFTIPEVGDAVSFPISTTSTGTFDTDQIHSAPMLVRYGDTALQSHGNYLVHYDLQFPLFNPTDTTKFVTLTFQTPIKQDQYSDRLTFFETPPDQTFFRGTVRVRYPDWSGQEVERYIHLVQRRGERSEPLAEIEIPAGEKRTATVDFFYPPDATPPQVITVKTIDKELF